MKPPAPDDSEPDDPLLTVIRIFLILFACLLGLSGLVGLVLILFRK